MFDHVSLSLALFVRGTCHNEKSDNFCESLTWLSNNEASSDFIYMF